MADDSRIDLGLSKIVSQDTSDKGSSMELPVSLEQTDTVETFDPEVENFLKAKNWKKISELCEVKSSSDALLAPYYRSLWVRAQVELRTTPVSMLVAPLDSAKKQLEAANFEDPKIFAAIDKQLKESFTSLAHELKDQDVELYQHCLKLSGADLEKKTVRPAISAISEPSAPTRKASKGARRQWLKPVLIMFLIGGLAGIAVYGFASKLYSSSPVRSELQQTSKPETEFPAGRRVGVLQHLDAVLYEAGGTRGSNGDSSKEIDLEPLAKKEMPWEKRERLEAKKQKREQMKKNQAAAAASAPKTTVKNNRLPKEVDFNGPIEPQEVKQKILAGEPIPSKSDDQGSIVPLRPDSQAHRYRLIARSQILVRPDYQAEAVGTLYPDQEVEVVEQGRIWLKLKAKSGRYGYILAQDAVLTQ